MTNGNNTPGLAGGQYSVTGYPVEESHESFCPSHRHRGPPSTTPPHRNGSYTTSEIENEHRREGQKGALFVLPLTVG